KGRETLFPLQQRSQQGRDIFGAVQTTSNLNDALLNELLKGRSPEEVFRYVYAVLNSTVYRARYVEYLKIDFPRVPLTGSAELFRSLARLGGELVALHLMESPKLDRTMTTYIGPKKPKVARVDWWQDTVWLDAPAKRKGQATTPGTVGFRGVPEIAWNFRIGGYQVCEKWLKDRKGRTLSKEGCLNTRGS